MQRLLPGLEPIDMPLGQVLYESGSQLRHVYFPTTAIVSLLYVMERRRLGGNCRGRQRRAWSGLRCSWAERPPRVVPWCKAPGMPIA